MSRTFELEIIRDPEHLTNLEPDWHRLYTQRPHHYFQSFRWAMHSWSHVASCHRHGLLVVVGRASGEIVLIWPLTVRSKWGMRLAQVLGPEAYDYSDILVANAPMQLSWIDAAYRELKHEARVDALHLKYVQSASALGKWVETLHLHHAPLQYTFCTRRDDWKSWDDYYQSRGRKLKYNLRSRLARLKELGNVDVAVAESATELEEMVAWTLQRKGKWIEDVQRDAPSIKREEGRRFLSEVVQDGFKHGNVVATRLKLDGQLAATHIGFASHSHLDMWISARDENLDKYAPSLIAWMAAFEWAFGHGMSVIDCGPGVEPYKMQWGNRQEAFGNYLIPCSTMGNLISLVRNTKYKLRSLKKRKTIRGDSE